MIDCPLCHKCNYGENRGSGVITLDNHMSQKRYIVCGDCMRKIQKIIDDMENGEYEKDRTD